jgi:hypothetical protein
LDIPEAARDISDDEQLCFTLPLSNTWPLSAKGSGPDHTRHSLEPGALNPKCRMYVAIGLEDEPEGCVDLTARNGVSKWRNVKVSKLLIPLAQLVAIL